MQVPVARGEALLQYNNNLVAESGVMLKDKKACGDPKK